MPTTPNGTVWTAHTTTLPLAGQSALYVADNALATDHLVIYLHGSGGTWNQFGSSLWTGTREGLLDRGIAVVECAGGDPTDQWGADGGVDAYAEAVVWARTIVAGGELVPFGRSHGGLVAYRLAMQSELADECVGLLINSGTTALRLRYTAATGQVLTDFNAAWGIGGTAKDEAAFATVSAGKDPLEDFPLTAPEHLHVMQLWGDADTTVRPNQHGQPWVDKYGEHCKSLTVDIRAGGDHSPWNGSYLQVPQMLDWFDRVWPTAEAFQPMRVVRRWFAATSGLLEPVSLVGRPGE